MKNGEKKVVKLNLSLRDSNFVLKKKLHFLNGGGEYGKHPLPYEFASLVGRVTSTPQVTNRHKALQKLITTPHRRSSYRIRFRRSYPNSWCSRRNDPPNRRTRRCCTRSAAADCTRQASGIRSRRRRANILPCSCTAVRTAANGRPCIWNDPSRSLSVRDLRTKNAVTSSKWPAAAERQRRSSAVSGHPSGRIYLESRWSIVS